MAHIEVAPVTKAVARTVPNNNDGHQTWVTVTPFAGASQTGIDPTLKLEQAPVTNEARKAALVARGLPAESV